MPHTPPVMIVAAMLAARVLAGVQFLPPTDFELAGAEPQRIEVCDLDGDGALDLIVSTSADGEVAFRFGNGAGGFPEEDSLQTGVAAWGLAAGDIDGDGDKDFAVSDGSGGAMGVKVYRNDGGGGFAFAQTLSAGAFPIAIALADFDGDGDADMGVAANVSVGLSVFFNDGSGAFAPGQAVAGFAGLNATDLGAADFDNDGDVDLAVAHYDGVAIAENDGAGGFAHAGSAGSAAGTTDSLAIGDFDNDGAADVASGLIYSGLIAVRLGNADLTFAPPVLLSCGSSCDDVLAADITGTGRDDLIAVNSATDRVYVFESLGGGAFAQGVWFSVGQQPWALGAGDFDQDGDPDLAVPSRNSGETPFVSVMLNDQQPPLCIELVGEPAGDTHAWAGHIAAFEVLAVGEPPLAYAWSKDGLPLGDGPTASGSLVGGSDSPALVISHITPADTGAYSVEVSGACGSLVAGAYALTVEAPPALPAAWSATSLHPAGALASTADAIDEGGQYGSITVFSPDVGINVAHPGGWSGGPGSFVDYTPAGSAGGAVLDAGAGVQVGWWWWPYPCGPGNTCYSKQAARWAGSPATHDNLQVSGWEYSQVNATDGVVHVGTKSDDDASGNTFAHAVIWTPPLYNSIDLHPPAGIASKSFGSAIDGVRQYGSYHTPFPAPIVRAAGWSGSSSTFFDMHPPGAISSWISCAGDGQQGGTASFGAGNVAGVWAGSPRTFMAMPASAITDCASGLQAGSAGGHATLWATDPAASVDLHAFVPAGFTSSLAQAIYVAPEGVIHVAGSGYNQQAQRTEALYWVSLPPLVCPEDLDGSGLVDSGDLNILLGGFGCTGGGCPGDIDADSDTDSGDLNLLLGAFGQGCPG